METLNSTLFRYWFKRKREIMSLVGCWNTLNPLHKAIQNQLDLIRKQIIIEAEIHNSLTKDKNSSMFEVVNN